MGIKGKNTGFFNDVYDVVRLIPPGRVSSYGAIAKYLGKAKNARMVGWAMASCPNNVPAHRVVNSAGLLTGKCHFKTPTTMQKRLEKEGVSVINDKIEGFSQKLWDPSRELA